MRSVAVLFAVLAVASGVLASDYTWTLNNPGAGSSFYTITGTGSVSGQNPTVTLPYGKTLHLDITTDAIHPVCIQTTNAVTGASDYANVVPANPQCVQSGTMDITLPASGSGTSVLYLHCHNHGFAITLNLQDPAVPSSSSTGAAAVSSSAAQSSTGAVQSSTGGSSADYVWSLVNANAADFVYTISGNGAVGGNNPTVTLQYGKTLHLNIASTSSHPVCVQTNNAVTGQSNYANVVPANPACVTTGTMDITLPSAASGTSAIYLHCEFHTFAVTINIDSGAGGSSTGGNAASGTAVASAAVVLLATAAAIALRA